MFIFDKEPNTWQKLQSLVCKAFEEMGCYAEIEKNIELVRGKKEIDVYVEDTIDNITFKILIECKNWKENIHQDVIHSFRTIVSDSGANKGIIIVKKGFQSGSLEASNKTPLELLTWKDFNTLYYKKWAASCEQRLKYKGKKLIEFRDDVLNTIENKPLNNLSNSDINYLHKLNYKLLELVILTNRNTLSELENGPIKILDLENEVIDVKNIKWVIINSYREWYDYLNLNLDSFFKEIREYNLNL